MIDQFGRSITYMRLSVTEQCNLRCRYCTPADSPPPRCEKLLTPDELLRIAEAGIALGVRKIRITGGEPLIRPDIVEICRAVAALPGLQELCLTTNGLLLPKYASALREAGVTRVNLSLDTLDAEKYRSITRAGRLSDALDGLHAALHAGFDKVKINTVLIGGFNNDEIRPLAALTQQHPVDVRFIELMPTLPEGGFGPEAYIPCNRVLEQLPEAVPVPEDGGVARLYRLPDAQGRIGLIAPLSRHFCAECSRIRVTADGKIKPCLHSAEEIPVKGLPQAEITERLIQAILHKPHSHNGLSAAQPSRAGRGMNRIGG